MAATPTDVQAKISVGQAALSKTTKSYAQMIKTYGSDWKKWPATSQWFVALNSLEAARTEAGLLVAPASPTASFSYKEG